MVIGFGKLASCPTCLCILSRFLYSPNYSGEDSPTCPLSEANDAYCNAFDMTTIPWGAEAITNQNSDGTFSAPTIGTGVACEFSRSAYGTPVAWGSANQPTFQSAQSAYNFCQASRGVVAYRFDYLFPVPVTFVEFEFEYNGNYADIKISYGCTGVATQTPDGFVVSVQIPNEPTDSGYYAVQRNIAIIQGFGYAPGYSYAVNNAGQPSSVACFDTIADAADALWICGGLTNYGTSPVFSGLYNAGAACYEYP